MGSIIGPNPASLLNKLLLLCEMLNIMLLPKTGATHCDAKFGLPEKGRAIKGFVVCCEVWLNSMKRMGLNTCTTCVCLVSCYRAQVPQNPIETYIYYLAVRKRENWIYISR